MSCTQKNINQTFIVPPNTMPAYNKTNSGIPLPPPPDRAYYFPSNFIIDSTGQVFFYQEQSIRNDDVRRDWNTIPKFINLRPEDIVQIPNDAIEAFIRLNILNIDSAKRYIGIASAKDTISSAGLSKIIKICEEKDYHIRWKFRKILQEEAIVLGYKKRLKKYYPEEITWDTTKIEMRA